MSQRYILCVDDDPMNLEILEAYLEDQFEIGFADGGNACLKFVAERRPDLILLDVMMPDLDGRDVCDKLKKDPGTKDIPIIFVTGIADSENVQELRAGLVDDVLCKPFSRDKVLELIEQYLP